MSEETTIETASAASPKNYPVLGDSHDPDMALWGISLSSLCVRAERHPNFRGTITDPSAFFRDVFDEMFRPLDDGRCLLDKAIDEAIENLIGAGCDGINQDHAALQQHQRDQENPLDAARVAHRHAEYKAAALQNRVDQLQATLQQHGIDIGS